MGGVDISLPELKKRDRLIYARQQVVQTVRKVIPYILIGVAIGAVIHNWIPESIIQSILVSETLLGGVGRCSWYSHVCWYFRGNPDCRSLVFKGRGFGYGAALGRVGGFGGLLGLLQLLVGALVRFDFLHQQMGLVARFLLRHAPAFAGQDNPPGEHGGQTREWVKKAMKDRNR